jgi:hypothetical protein
VSATEEIYDDRPIPSIPVALHELEEASVRKADLERALAQAQWELEEATRTAKRAGAKMSSIARAAGLSRQRIHHFTQGVRSIDDPRGEDEE